MDLDALRTTTSELIGRRLEAARIIAIAALLGGLLLMLLGLLVSGTQVLASYLVGYLFWFEITLGALGWLMLHHIVGGGWGFVLRRVLEATTRLLPLMALLFVPVALGMLFGILYPWARAGAAADPILAWRQPYLNPLFFLVRTTVYFAAWITLATLFDRWGRRLETTEDPVIVHRLNLLGAGGLVAYLLTASFAAFDWIMSLDAHWYSSLFGLLAISGQALGSLAAMLALVAALAGDRPLPRQVPSASVRDLGNLLLATVLVWAYLAFSQYLIVWSGNLVETIPWYRERMRGGWDWIPVALVVFHFALPFGVLLLGVAVKRNLVRIGPVAALLLVMRWVDLFWWAMPELRARLIVLPSDLGAVLLIGGVWLWWWLREIADRPIVPLHDPRLRAGLREAGEA